MNSIALADSCKLESWECKINNGCVIRGQRTPPTEKPVIHFLHGNGFCGLSYWPFLSHLSCDFDLFIHDIQGHGDSDAGDRFWGWNENARVVHQVWQQFQSDYSVLPVLAMGHSLGGILTALLAAEQPTLFNKLVLLDPVMFTPNMLIVINLLQALHLKSPNPLVKKALRRRNQWSSLREAKQDFEGRGIFKSWHDDALQAHLNHALYEHAVKDFRLKCSPAREAEIFASFPRKLWPSLKKINTPTAVLYGSGTYPFVKKSAKLLQSWGSPHFSFSQLRGGHCFMQEDPVVAAKEVSKIVAGMQC